MTMRPTDSQPEFVTLDVFTDRLYGGNPLAVFPDAPLLDAAEMQQIAREFNLSETVFVRPPDDPAHSRRLRIFTPAAELPFAGHPTVGTAHALAALGYLELAEDAPNEIVFEEGIGPVAVAIDVREREPHACELTLSQAPERRPAGLASDQIARLLGLPDDALAAEPGAEMLSCGVPYLCVPLNSRAALGRAQLDRRLAQTLLGTAWAQAVYVYVVLPESRLVHARMFAPALGVTEDPATGSAAAALAGRLAVYERVPDGESRWIIRQGEDMGRPSRIELRIERRAGRLVRIGVGGRSVLVARGRLLRPAGAPLDT
jgi:trans-2,3-dihydro-3-hydroxyanthranilate isomerase